MNGHFLNVKQHQGNVPRHFEDVGDLNNIQQDNADQGWEMPLPSPQNNMGWGQWLQQEGELVGENELAQVNNLANIVVANAIANAVMQHPKHP